MDNIRIFSPIVNGNPLLPEEYMLKYPELSERDETKNLRPIELIWCWYYSAPESPFVLESKSHEVKCKEITELVFGIINRGRTYDNDKIDRIAGGQLHYDFIRAIEFFKTRNKEVRKRAKDIIDRIFDEYEKIVEEGSKGFKDKDGGLDYSKYTATMRRITEEMADLIKKKEEGYGVSEHIGFTDSMTEGDYWNQYYHKTKG